MPNFKLLDELRTSALTFLKSDSCLLTFLKNDSPVHSSPQNRILNFWSSNFEHSFSISNRTSNVKLFFQNRTPNPKFVPSLMKSGQYICVSMCTTPSAQSQLSRENVNTVQLKRKLGILSVLQSWHVYTYFLVEVPWFCSKALHSWQAFASPEKFYQMKFSQLLSLALASSYDIHFVVDSAA